MTHVFEAVFPELDFSIMDPSLSYSRSPDIKNVTKQFERAAAEAIKILCLKNDRAGIVAKRDKVIRDIYLAELVAEYSDFRADPPRFLSVTKVKKDLSNLFNMSPDDWRRNKSNNEVCKINEKSLYINSIPDECRMSSFDMFDNAWDKYKNALLEFHVAQLDRPSS